MLDAAVGIGLPRRLAEGVVVVGMHRSGTSAVTEMLHHLGLQTGPDDDVMTADDSNRRGYWESRALTDFQELLLNRLGGTWDEPPSTEDGWENHRGLVLQVGRARRLVQRLYGDRHWAWKDPRTSLLLPFWRRVLGRMPPVVAIYRNPLEVALSLAKRDGFSQTKSLGLWEAYNRAWMRGAQASPALVLSYERLVAEPTKAVESLRNFLERNGLPVRFPADAETSVDRTLRHAIRDDSDVESAVGVTDTQRSLLELLHRLEGAHEPLQLA